MSSGYSLQGGPGRCYDNWMDVMKCGKEMKAGALERSECQLQLSDYMECLYHMREKARLSEMREEIVARNNGNVPWLPRRKGLVTLGKLDKEE
ncbi:uncharacterized protein V1518DRAFT_419049 [Limtongia smithiae]|uniref:uncharacterized protein n=1 Tax=Limtongia smithiae TaxID=1125753 RepID=UPI0034CDAD9C